MVQFSYLASTVLMGLIVVAVAIGAARLGARRAVTQRSASEQSEVAGGLLQGRTRWLTHSPAGWSLVFIVTAILLGVLALLYVDPALVGLEANAVGGVLIPLGAAVIGGYVLLATYFAALSNGHSTARAIAECTIIAGVLLLVGVMAVLIA